MDRQPRRSGAPDGRPAGAWTAKGREVSPSVANRPDAGRAGTADRRRAAPLAYIAGIVALALIFTLGGAYDTDGLVLGHRLLLWLTVSVLVVGQTVMIEHGLAHLLPRKRLFRVFSAAGASLATLLLVTLELDLMKQTPLLPKARDPFWEFLGFLAPLVLTVSGFVLLLRALAGIGPDRLAKEAEEAVRLIAAQPVIAGLLPAPSAAAGDFGQWPVGRVLSVQANDHYLDVTAETGRVFVRGRMRDAVARLRGAGGIQIHRSWWVATDRIARIEREGRDHVAVLETGERIPVGRSRIRQLKARGLV